MADEYPVSDVYSERWEQKEQHAYLRMTKGPDAVVAFNQDALDKNAEAIGKMQEEKRAAFKTKNPDKEEPPMTFDEARLKLFPKTQTSEGRAIVNKVLGTLTGGVLSLDELDMHFQAQALGIESPLAKKINSIEGLKALDPIGNVATELVRTQATKEGLPPDVVEEMASAAGLVSVMFGWGGRRVATDLVTNSLFSNPASHVANVTATGLMTAWSVPERFLQASSDLLLFGVTAGKHKREVYFGEVGALLIGMVHGLTDAAKAGARTMVTGQAPFGSSIINTTIPPVPTWAQGTYLGAAINFWSHAWRSPTLGLMAEDAFAKVINYNAEIWAQAYRETAGAGALAATVPWVRHLVRNPSQVAMSRAKDHALLYTATREYEELGPGFRKVGALGETISEMGVGMLPLGKLIVPIVRTPVNLAHMTMERTPIIGMLSKTLRSDLAAGGLRASQAMGKQAAGASLAVPFVYLGYGDLLTGGGPIDPGLRQQKKELTGWLPYTVKIGDTRYTVDRLSPVGAMLGIIADYSEIAGQVDDKVSAEFGQALALAVARNITSKVFLEQVSDLLDATAGDKPALNKLTTGAGRILTPGAARAITRATDPLKRETDPGHDPEQKEWKELRHMINEMRAGIPGYSKDLLPELNLFGEEIEIPKGLVANWLSPVYYAEQKDRPAHDEVFRLMKLNLLRVGRLGRTVLGDDPETHLLDEPMSPLSVGIKLTDKEYHRYVKLAGNDLKEGGKGMRDTILETIATDEYKKNMSDVERALTIHAIIYGFRGAALGKLLEENPGILQTYEQRLKNMEKAAEQKVELPPRTIAPR